MKAYNLRAYCILGCVTTLILLGSCATLFEGSTLVLQTEPTQAEVYVQVEGKKDRIKVGNTPMEFSEVQLAQQLKLSAESTQWVQFTFEKKEFMPRTVMVPSSRWGEKSKIMKIQLNPNTEQSTIAKEIISHFFNAKKFAETKQFDQAHSEIDKVLELDPKSTQALTMKAGIFYLQNKMEESKKYYKDALNIDPSSSDAIKMLEKIQNLGDTK
jgi:tetratricopeptide (TPR) repeat protein